MAEKITTLNGDIRGTGGTMMLINDSTNSMMLINDSTNSGSSTSTTSGSSTSTTSGSSTSQTSQISDSMAVELMLTEETPIKDANTRNTFTLDELDFINSSIPPNQYSYATTYYTTFYVRNYSYNWNANSYLSVNINGNITDIYADSYDTVRMDYYPPEAPKDKDVIDVIKFHVDSDTTSQYKSFERGNYIVWNNSGTSSTYQPYCYNGLLYIDGNFHQDGLTYATVSKNLKFVLDPETSNDEINAIKQWWINSYFTYVANIWEYTGDTNVSAEELVNTSNDVLTSEENKSIILSDIPDTTNEYVLICGNFGFIGEKCTITVVVDPANSGTVSGGGTYDVGDEIEISATQSGDYIFDHWNDGDTNATRTITANEDCIYTAYFVLDTNCTITVESDGNGTVSGGGTYDASITNNIEIEAFPYEHYHFVRWDDENDGNTNNPRIIPVEDDATYRATFALNEYNIQVAYDLDNMALDNNIYINDDDDLHSGDFTVKETVTLNAKANIDIGGGSYTFTGWKVRVNDNDTIINIDPYDPRKWQHIDTMWHYMFNPTSDAIYYAQYEKSN